MSDLGSLPEFDSWGNLPPGIHSASLDEVERLFGKFQQTDRRLILFRQLKAYLREILLTEWDVDLILDGSFVMSRVDEPEDIDAILVLPHDWDLSAELRPFEYNLLSRKRTRKTYGFDVFAVRRSSMEYNYWTEFFMQISPKWLNHFSMNIGARKGLIRIAP